jgi:NAD(P)-dependent dehydrogenase (short-subunit alcohol dehydrogenase family)
MTEQQVVIIGGSEGIGLAVAKAACTLGARVLAVSRTRESCDDYPSEPAPLLDRSFSAASRWHSP